MKIGIVGESRYIDANKLIERLMHNPDFLTAPKHSKDKIIDEIVYQPIADVVEVVRCKDCKYYIYDGGKYPYCEIMSNKEEGEYYGPSADHYCSYGERS